MSSEPVPTSRASLDARANPADAGRLVAWASAVLAGEAGPEPAAAAVAAGSDGHVVTGLPLADELPLPEAMRWLRDCAPRRVALVLPAAGDPLGLRGGSPLANEALEAGMAVVFDSADGSFGWAPVPDRRGSSYRGVRWRCLPGGADMPALTVDPERLLVQADRALRRALRAAADALSDVDLALWRAETSAGRAAADAAMRERVRALPAGWPATARELGERALGLWRVVELAAADQGAASSSGLAVRGQTLRELSRAVREAATTAFNVPAAALLARG